MRPDGIILYGKLGFDFLFKARLLYRNQKVRLHLVRARPNFYKISDYPNVSLEIVDCSLCTRRIALKNDCHGKRKDMFVCTTVEYNYFQTLAETFIITARQNQFFRKNIINNDPFCQIATTKHTKSAFTGLYREDPFSYH